ncbi:F0F1 ATP synthase subunit B' [Actibacterium pelagium]|uniref:ATP synthase subunit b n=1 Tax=Actibacterium pelagium TaxID=2029103 RepID=A0A917AIM1_9RHOB|nr:F0F1 ATP synthase subunit B' [Actibacterium pelagium]GGE51658.1 ATP synthase subunit b 2 [Actibacterium pelagium]
MASETKEAASHAADAAASAPGMPQLDFSNWGNQIFWLVITLVVIYFILSRIALPRIASVLSERQGTITNDLAMAEELKLKAQEAEAAYQQALTDARAEANKIVADARAEIQADLDVATAKAEAEISAKSAESEKKIAEIREGAMEAVTEVAKDAAKEIVSALGQKADARSVTAAVNARLKG